MIFQLIGINVMSLIQSILSVTHPLLSIIINYFGNRM